VALNACCLIKAQLREIAMSNFAFGVPVKTRLPIKVWSLAAIVTLFSLASSIIHSHDASDHAIYAGVAASPRIIKVDWGQASKLAVCFVGGGALAEARLGSP
jgi:hypothetical protein